MRSDSLGNLLCASYKSDLQMEVKFAQVETEWARDCPDLRIRGRKYLAHQCRWRPQTEIDIDGCSNLYGLSIRDVWPVTPGAHRIDRRATQGRRALDHMERLNCAASRYRRLQRHLTYDVISAGLRWILWPGCRDQIALHHPGLDIFDFGIVGGRLSLSRTGGTGAIGGCRIDGRSPGCAAANCVLDRRGSGCRCRRRGGRRWRDCCSPAGRRRRGSAQVGTGRFKTRPPGRQQRLALSRAKEEEGCNEDRHQNKEDSNGKNASSFFSAVSEGWRRKIVVFNFSVGWMGKYSTVGGGKFCSEERNVFVKRPCNRGVCRTVGNGADVSTMQKRLQA